MFDPKRRREAFDLGPVERCQPVADLDRSGAEGPPRISGATRGSASAQRDFFLELQLATLQVGEDHLIGCWPLRLGDDPPVE